MKKIVTVLLTLLILSMALIASPAEAAADFSVTDSSVTITFPSEIDFELSAQSDADITDVRLHYYVDRISYARVTSEIYFKIDPAKTISTQWSWDMRKTGGLPPGTTIYYWWSMKNAQGETYTTEKLPLLYEDNRFNWKSIYESNITLYWYEGSDDFAEQLLTASIEGLETLYETTGVDFTDSVELYIYSDASDLQNAMIFPQDWTGGVAYPSYGCIAIGIDPSNLDWGLRTVVHELTHLVTHRQTENPYLDLPTWLDEGLSMVMEGKLTENFIFFLKSAVDNDQLISVTSLASPFSAYAAESYLSYAESYMMVDLLIERYGRGKMLELLTVLSLGTSYNEAMTEVYGFDMDGFNDIFMEYMKEVDLDSNAGNSIKIGLLPATGPLESLGI